MRIIAAALLVFLSSSPAVARDCSEAAKLAAKAGSFPEGSKESESALRDAIRNCPELADAYYALGLQLLAQERPKEALESFKSALSKGKENPKYILGQAAAQVKLDLFDDARTSYKAILEEDGSNVKALQGLAAASFKLGDLAGAEDALRRGLQEDPNNAELFYNLGIILEADQRPEEALVSYKAAVQKRRSYGAAFERIARLNLELRHLDDAQRAAREAGLYRPKDIEVWLTLARIQEALGELNQAESSLAKAQGIDSKNRDLLVNQGIILYKLGKSEEAMVRLRRAVELNPDFAAAHGALGWAYLQQKQYSLAEDALLAALRADPNDAFAHNNLGVLFEATGRADKAKEEFARAKALRPGMKIAERNLSRLSD